VERHRAQGGSTLLHARTQRDLVVTASSNQPVSDGTAERWQRRPHAAALIRVVVIGTPLVASVVAGIAAGRLFRPHGWVQIAGWVLWTAAVSIAVLAVVDAVVRRLLPLQRLLQLCLVFPDKAPSRWKVAARAARLRRSERRSRAARAATFSRDGAASGNTSESWSSRCSGRSRRTTASTAASTAIDTAAVQTTQAAICSHPCGRNSRPAAMPARIEATSGAPMTTMRISPATSGRRCQRSSVPSETGWLDEAVTTRSRCVRA